MELNFNHLIGSQRFRAHPLYPSTTQNCLAPIAAQVFPPGSQLIGSLWALTSVHLPLRPLMRLFKSQLQYLICPKTILVLQRERCYQAACDTSSGCFISQRVTHLPPTQDFEHRYRGWSWLKGASHAAPGLVPDVLIAELRRGWCFPSCMSIHQEGKKVAMDGGGVERRRKNSW